MDDFILQARLYEAEQHGDIEKLSGVVQQGAGQAVKDVARGVKDTYMNWANEQKPVTDASGAPVMQTDEAGQPTDQPQTERGRSRANPFAWAGKIAGKIGEGVSAAGRLGQQKRTGLDPETQKRMASHQAETAQLTAQTGMEQGAANIGKPVSNDPRYQAELDTAGAATDTAGQPADAYDPAQSALPDISGILGGSDVPDLDPGGQPATPTAAQQAATATQQQTGGTGQTPAQPPAQTPAQMQVGVDQAARAKGLAETKGGFGTGIMSNLLTGGVSGIVRGLHNRGQRQKGQRAQADIQAGRPPTWKSYPDMDDAYDTISIRTAIQERNTTEALRNGLR